MRENCTSGSVRGASGNRGSYRKRLLVPVNIRHFDTVCPM